MILSNEPGYYKAGEYGIRIENLLLVVERDINGCDEPMLAFETLTFAPIDRDLIDPAILTPDELSWLNAYHQQVVATIGPLLGEESRTWVRQRCAPVT
jgi:Xaa-Pro aminopeptidase